MTDLSGLTSYTRKAIDLGYIRLHPSGEGWNLKDYFDAAIYGEKQPDEIIRKGWECVLTWGRQGTGKSNLNFQLAYEVYQDWDIVMKYTVMGKDEMDAIYDQARTPGKKIKLVNLDDVTTTLPKHLWFLDVFDYANLHSFMAVARPRIAVILCSTPRPQNLITPITDNVTFEIFCYPGQAGSGSHYMIERYCESVDPQHRGQSELFKVPFPERGLNLSAVPSDVWKQYEDRRWRVSDQIVEKMKSLGKDDAENVEPFTADRVRKCFPGQMEVIDTIRTKYGFKFKEAPMQRALTLYKEMTLAKALKLEAEEPLPSEKEETV